jgi:hypothetical protein
MSTPLARLAHRRYFFEDGFDVELIAQAGLAAATKIFRTHAARKHTGSVYKLQT